MADGTKDVLPRRPRSSLYIIKPGTLAISAYSRKLIDRSHVQSTEFIIYPTVAERCHIFGMNKLQKWPVTREIYGEPCELFKFLTGWLCRLCLLQGFLYLCCWLSKKYIRFDTPFWIKKLTPVSTYYTYIASLTQTALFDNFFSNVIRSCIKLLSSDLSVGTYNFLCSRNLVHAMAIRLEKKDFLAEKVSCDHFNSIRAVRTHS